jgi:hypothetical protein
MKYNYTVSSKEVVQHQMRKADHEWWVGRELECTVDQFEDAIPEFTW